MCTVATAELLIQVLAVNGLAITQSAGRATASLTALCVSSATWLMNLSSNVTNVTGMFFMHYSDRNLTGVMVRYILSSPLPKITVV